MLSSDEKLDPRARRTRGLILGAFSDLLAEKGFEAITVQDVSDRAQINRVTFYAHFQDKYKLLDTWIRQRFEQETEKRMLDACHYTPENLRHLIMVVCEFLAGLHNDCAQPHLQFEALVETEIKKQVYELLAHWLEQGKTSVPVEIPATVATWAIYGLASHWSHGTPAVPGGAKRKRPALEKYVDEAFPFVAVNLQLFA